MKVLIKRKRREHPWERFDAKARYYQIGRPGYPEKMADAALELARVPPGGRVLEVGCGTGQATRLFARRDVQITCLEPGKHLPALARRALARFTNVRIVTIPFERWRGRPGKFDLVLAAASIHHVDPRRRYALAARALRPGGALAICGNYPGKRPPRIARAMDAAYARWAGSSGVAPMSSRIKWMVREIRASGLFRPPIVRRFPWRVPYTPARYAALRRSDSLCIGLSQVPREKIIRELARIVRSVGGRYREPFIAVLYIARKTGR